MSAKSNRRRFLWKALKAAVPLSLGTAKVNAGNHQKIKLMTSEGRIVEMDQELLDQAARRTTGKTTNKEILNWTNQVKTKTQGHE